MLCKIPLTDKFLCMKLRWKIAQAAEIKWWQNYLKNKPKADYLQWKKDYWRDLVAKTGIQLKPNDRVMDAGCGPAGVFMVLEDQKVDALDPLLEQYEQKLAHFDRQAYPNVDFFAQPLEDFSATEEYDTLFCLNAINHVSDLEACFDKLVKATKTGGNLVVSIDAHNYSFFKHTFRLLPGDILHPHQYDLDEYQKMLINRGCTVSKSLLFKKEFFFDYYVLVAQK